MIANTGDGTFESNIREGQVLHSIKDHTVPKMIPPPTTTTQSDKAQRRAAASVVHPLHLHGGVGKRYITEQSLNKHHPVSQPHGLCVHSINPIPFIFT